MGWAEINRTIAERGVFWCCPTSAGELLWLLVTVPHIIAFLDCRGSRHHNCVWVFVSGMLHVWWQRGKTELYMACTFLSWWWWWYRVSRMQVFFLVFCRCQMCCIASPPLPLPVVPAWAQGLNQSIRAPGTGAQQCLCAAQRSAALSGSVHLHALGASWGN